MEELKEFVYNDLTDEWFDTSNADDVYKIALELLEHNLSIDNIKNIITRIYKSISNEYGN